MKIKINYHFMEKKLPFSNQPEQNFTPNMPKRQIKEHDYICARPKLHTFSEDI